MRKLLLSFLIIVFGLQAFCQKLPVRRFDSNYDEDSKDTFTLGDLIIIGFTKQGETKKLL